MFLFQARGVQAQPLSLVEKCKNLEEIIQTIQRVATNTIAYTKKQANKEWFDEECAKMIEEKNAARERAIQINTREAKNAYKLAGTKERRLCRKRQGSSTKRLQSRMNDIGVFTYLLMWHYNQYLVKACPRRSFHDCLS
jgi:hypothetical protein